MNDCTYSWGADDNIYIIPVLSVSKFKHKTTEKTAQCELLSFGSEVENLYAFAWKSKKNYSPPKDKIK